MELKGFLLFENWLRKEPFLIVKMDKKYQELLKKRGKARQRLAEAIKNFKGVKHEDSASELQELQLKVARAYLVSIEEEIKKFEK